MVLAFIERMGDEGRHRIRILPPILPEKARGAEAQAAVRALVAETTAAVEAAIRQTPDQWVWTHRRWRTQPLGEARPYPPRGPGRDLAQTGGAAGR